MLTCILLSLSHHYLLLTSSNYFSFYQLARGGKFRDGFGKYAEEIFVTKMNMNALKELKANLKNEKKDAENKDKQFAGNAKDEEIKTLKEK